MNATVAHVITATRVRTRLLVPWRERGVVLPEQLSWLEVAGIAGLLSVWRLAILGCSVLWGRVGVVTAWPPDIDVMWLWRYSVRWDAGWYLGIVRYGYEYQPGRSTSVAFFPLFPMLINATNRVLPGGDVLAALVVVHLALAAACVYVYQIVKVDYGRAVAGRTLAFLLLFPGAFFYSAVYAEALLLVSLAGALYHARRGQWTRAGLWGIAASATKIVGLLLPLVLLVEILTQRQLSRKRWQPLLAPALSTLGGLAYFVYLQLRFGDFRVFFHSETTWHRQAGHPVFFMGIHRLMGYTGDLVYYPTNGASFRSLWLLLDTSLLWIFLALGVYLWLRVRPSYGALVLLFTLIPALSGSPQSLNRYVAVLFPAFIVLGRIRSEAARSAITVAFTMGLAFTTFLFVQGYWAG